MTATVQRPSCPQSNLTKPDTVQRPRTKKHRSIRLLCWLPELSAGVVCITEGVKSDYYHIKRFTADFGFAFEITKHVIPTEGDPYEQEPYQVCINEGRSICDCKGFCRWNHCRHVEGLTALLNRNTDVFNERL